MPRMAVNSLITNYHQIYYSTKLSIQLTLVDFYRFKFKLHIHVSARMLPVKILAEKAVKIDKRIFQQ